MSDQADSFVTPITEKETMEFFVEGLKQAADAAKQLAIAQDHQIWARIAIACSELRLYGMQLAYAKSINRQDTLKLIDRREKFVNAKVEEKRPSKLLVN